MMPNFSTSRACLVDEVSNSCHVNRFFAVPSVLCLRTDAACSAHETQEPEQRRLLLQHQICSEPLGGISGANPVHNDWLLLR